ncbi:unnamed protein product [Phytophthora fragariaefolia]|uniref:Unnamed protein product n=1 Tax=Phytophthora fragariaefolia TaxID=1490495 RepID=A0A9W6UB65_9STRA|nr:unnamed protein product [Phytophthora fragariaefolia]
MELNSKALRSRKQILSMQLPTLEIYLADLHDEDVNEDDYPSDVNEDFFDDESDLSSDSDSSDSESSDTSITSDDENETAN